jgi:hypothetical protein
MLSGLQDWSRCVDSERKTGGDFAADCREQVHLRILKCCCASPIAELFMLTTLCKFGPADICLVRVCAEVPFLVLQTYALRECMLKHREYYAPVLEEEVRH